MRPALYINELTSGGAERLVKDLALDLYDRPGVDPGVIVGRENGEIHTELERSPVQVHSLGVEIASADLPVAARRLVRLLEAEQFDVVHSHLAFSHLTSRMACTWANVPQVSTYHNIREHKPFVKRALERITEPLCSELVCVSEGVQKSFPWSSRYEVIYNAIDVHEFRERVAESRPPDFDLEPGTDATLFLNVARCVDQKRQKDLLRAMTEVQGKEIFLIIVGDGPLREDLEREVRELGLEDRVYLAGYVDAVEPFYAAADAFVSSSENEGLPTTHIEAMAAGLPVVSTDIPGVREMIDDGRNGYLCPVNDPAELANRMRDLHEVDRHQFSERSREIAANRFSLETVAAKHAELYDRLV